MVCVHSNNYYKTMYKGSMHMVMYNNKGMRTLELPSEDTRMFIQGRSQNWVGFDNNPLRSDAKPKAMPGGVQRLQAGVKVTCSFLIC